MDLVSKSALTSLGPELLISLHRPRSTQLQAIVSKPKKMLSGFRSVAANINGYIDRECLSVLAKFGLTIDTSMLKQNSSSGGHAFLRYVADTLQSNSLSRILQTDSSQLLVDVGAKFGSNFQILTASCALYGTNVPSCIDDAEYRCEYIRKNV